MMNGERVNQAMRSIFEAWPHRIIEHWINSWKLYIDNLRIARIRRALFALHTQCTIYKTDARPITSAHQLPFTMICPVCLALRQWTAWNIFSKGIAVNYSFIIQNMVSIARSANS